MLASTYQTVSRRRCGTIVLCCAALVMAAVSARADQITAKGDTLHGKVLNMADGYLVFETEYAKDKLTIKYEDLTDIRTDAPVQLLYGEDGESVGRLLGMRDRTMLIGTDMSTATAVDVAAITAGTPTEGLSWQDRARSNFRYWHGSFDLGFGLTRSRIDDTTLALGFSLTRKKAPTRFFLDIIGAYGKQESDEFVVNAAGTGIDKVTTDTRSQDSLLGRVREEYDLTKKLYAFGSADALYDGIQRISLRAVPKAGLGYRIWETKTDLFQVEAGGAYVYEKDFGGDTNDFFAIAFGWFLDTNLWYGTHFTWRMDYLPAVTNWIGDYLLRNELALTVPIFDPFKLKLSFIDEYDSTPATEDFTLTSPVPTTVTLNSADYNKLIFTIGVSFAF